MPIIFESDKLGVCRTSIQYSLNKCFQSNIQISVNVVRPYLKLRDTQIKMHFDSRHGKNTTQDKSTHLGVVIRICSLNGFLFSLLWVLLVFSSLINLNIANSMDLNPVQIMKINVINSDKSFLARTLGVVS